MRAEIEVTIGTDEKRETRMQQYAQALSARAAEKKDGKKEEK